MVGCRVDRGKGQDRGNLTLFENINIKEMVEMLYDLHCRTQVVGWPPVRSFRKNIVNVHNQRNEGGGAAAFVKVSMDGAPYLRKVDIRLYKSYQELSEALAKMFSSFTIQKCGSQGSKDFINETKLIDLLNGSDYVPTYEDKDGDWMLVGDVPWESVSFIHSLYLSFLH